MIAALLTLMMSPTAKTVVDIVIVPDDVEPSMHVCEVLDIAHALKPPVAAGSVALNRSVFV